MVNVNALLLFNLVLCLVGCFLAALLGHLTRKTGNFRLLLGLLVAPMFSWFAWATAGGHGGGGYLPSVYMFFLLILNSDGSRWRVFNDNEGLDKDFIFVSSWSYSFS